ncbi:MAG TPA: glycosyltransferase [Candidatus Binatia bacterium]|nr:glycosyltransferase [Candidatus Binatia bacterium]
MRVLVIGGSRTPDESGFDPWLQLQIDSLRRAGVYVDSFVVQRGERGKYARAVPRLRAVLARQAYDVVHAHYGYAGIVAALQRRVPSVVTFHGDDLLGTPDASGRATSWSRLWVQIHRRMAAHVDAVIAVSEEMARVLDRRDVHVIPCGVDTELFVPRARDDARRRLGWDTTRRYVLFAANPAFPRKCFPVARAAVDLLNRSRPDPIELVCTHSQPRAVVPYEEVPWYMAAADALAVTAYWEGGPVVVKEAMACNLPIVSADVGDVRRVIGDTGDCHIVARDPGAVATALAAVLDPPRRTNGRARAELVALPRIAERLIAVYEAVLRSHQTVRAPAVGDQSHPVSARATGAATEPG